MEKVDLKRKFSKTINSEQWNKIRSEENEYPNLEVVKKEILQLEEIVAKNFLDLKTALRKRKGRNTSQLEIDLEWFLTWRIKLVAYRTCLWCDGVEISELKSIGDLKFFIDAETWLGPESNVSKEYKCKMTGIISVNRTFNMLESYNLEIDYRNDRISVIK